jgi:hypothetical protein
MKIKTRQKHYVTYTKKLLILFAFLTQIQTGLFAQDKDERIDELIEQGNFDEAIQIGTGLLSDDPNNANMNFKVGYSYLNTALRKAKSIPYFEKTIEIINKTKTNTSFTFEANFYLGKAYHNNYEFEKAIKIYTALKETTKNNELLKSINEEIAQCEMGIELMKNPVKMQINNLGDKINSSYSDHSPVISADESVIIFTSRRKSFQNEELNEDGQYNEDIYISFNENNSWQTPRNISPKINTNEHEASIALSPDGQQLFIYSSLDAGTILTSYLNGEEWSAPENLGENINTRYRETDASLTADGKYLYFTSDRPGGYGGIDIYISEKQEDGNWGKAKNLGPTINTSSDEDGPFIHQDGVTLLFSSKGHATMGGFDIFRSKINEFGTWTKPENVGYPINTIDDDVFLAMTPDGKRAYFSSFREGGFGKSDIYMMALPEAEEKPVTIVKGNVKTCKSDINDVLITVFDKENDDLIGLYKPNSKTGKYLFILPKGRNYYATYEVNGQEKAIEEFFISNNADFQVIYKPISLIEGTPCDKTVVIGEDSEVKNNDLYSGWKAAGYTVVENIIFKINSSQCEKFKNNLSTLATYLKENPNTQVELIGYSDTQGPETYNLKLSKKRALIVYNKLVHLGVDKSQMKYRGDGTKNQITINNYNDGSYIWESLPYNRRVEINVSNDTKDKLKIVPVKVPVFYDKKAKPEDAKKEINRLDSIYTIQLGAYSTPVQRKVFGNIKNVQMYYTGKLYKYSSGEYKSEKEAKDELKRILDLGYSDAYIRKVSEYFPKMLEHLH